MRKKTFLAAVGILFSLFIPAACSDSPEDNVVNAERFRITNIPTTIARGGNDYVASYKIYVQISRGTNKNAGNVAEGEALLSGATSITVDLKKPKSDKRWSGSGPYNVAIIISPQTAPTYESLLVKAYTVVLNQQVQAFNFAGGYDMWNLPKALGNGVENIQEIYNGVILEDPDITTP